MPPELAMTETFDVPAGVPTIEDVDEQPPIRLPAASRTTKAPRIRRPANCLRRRMARNDPKGRSRANDAAMPGCPRRPSNLPEAVRAAVWIVRVVVAGALAATVSGLVAKLHVAPAGRLPQVKVTEPAKELVGPTPMVSLVDEPAVTEATCEEALTLKVAALVALATLVMTPKSPWASLPIPASK